tara:strand:+ start:2662 stop:2877 length:216 start_codon:yes stop_codon:yes gene_type:complete
MEIVTEINGRLTSTPTSIDYGGVTLSTSLGDVTLPWDALYQLMAQPEVAETLELVEIFSRPMPLSLLSKKE